MAIAPTTANAPVSGKIDAGASSDRDVVPEEVITRLRKERIARTRVTQEMALWSVEVEVQTHCRPDYPS
jgi:hypothetical protein